MMWYEECVFYQIYPLGLCGAPAYNDGQTNNRIDALSHWVNHIKQLGCGAVYFGPVFQSDAHGYDTRDFLSIDCRLGTNQNFSDIVRVFHENGIRVILDGVFHHVGRGFFAFLDVQKRGKQSCYRDWFYLDFNGDSPYHDGFWYEGWEGHFELVKLNLQNTKVQEYLLDCVKQWIDWWEIDGLRLDVAYLLEENFIRRLRQACCLQKPEFFLVGEMIHGDYNRLLGPELLHSVTNYECYKGLYSAFNSKNMFEIGHSLQRQFGEEPWCLYRGKHLFSFADNHDVTRIASILHLKEHLPLVFGFLLAMPGIPCVYYGSEWGIEGDKSCGDQALRPAIDDPKWNELTEKISVWAKIRTNSEALCYGNFKILAMTNEQIVFERQTAAERVLAACNSGNQFYLATGEFGAKKGKDLQVNQEQDFCDGIPMPPYSIHYWKV